MDALLVPYDAAYWAVHSSLPAEEKLVQIKKHLQEMAPLAKAMGHTWVEEEQTALRSVPAAEATPVDVAMAYLAAVADGA